MGGLRGGRRAGRNLYRLPSGRYVVRLYERPTGRPEREIWRAFDRREDAVRFRAVWKADRAFRSAGLRPATPSAPLTLGDLFDRYVGELRTFGRSEEQVRKVEQARRLTLSALGANAPAPASREDLVTVARWAFSNSRTHGDAVHRAFGLLRTAHRRAGLPPPDAPEVRVEHRPRRSLSPTELRAFLTALPRGSVERVTALLVLTTGIREREAFRLRVGDVDLAARTIVSTPRKGAAPAAVALGRHPIGPRLWADLRAFLAKLPAGVGPQDPLLGVVSSRRGDPPARHPLTIFSLRAALRRACRKAGIPVLHGLGWLRHASATGLVASGETVETARRLLGHASSRTTERHYDEAALWASRKAAAGRLERLLVPPPFPRPGRRATG